jgi:hypothetical protein
MLRNLNEGQKAVGDKKLALQNAEAAAEVAKQYSKVSYPIWRLS